jgi:hypothetical protein
LVRVSPKAISTTVTAKISRPNTPVGKTNKVENIKENTENEIIETHDSIIIVEQPEEVDEFVIV